MLRYLFNRLFHAVLVLFVISFIVFYIMYKTGDPVEMLLPPDATQQHVEEMRKHLGLDQPFAIQYGVFLGNLLEGNVGYSFIYGQPALTVVAERFPASLELAVAAMFIAVILGIPCGVISAVRPRSLLSRGIMLFSIAGISVPVFWTGMVLVLIFSIFLGVLPSSGRGQLLLGTSLLTMDGLRHLVMPVITLAMFQLALIIRLTRTGMMEVLMQDYIKLARAKGLPNSAVIYCHALKNALIPVITVIGIQFGHLLAFGIITETIFAWPGTGKLVIDSIQNSDRPVVVAYLLLVALIFVSMNFIVDLLYTLIDPRVRVK